MVDRMRYTSRHKSVNIRYRTLAFQEGDLYRGELGISGGYLHAHFKNLMIPYTTDGESLNVDLNKSVFLSFKQKTSVKNGKVISIAEYEKITTPLNLDNLKIEKRNFLDAVITKLRRRWKDIFARLEEKEFDLAHAAQFYTGEFLDRCKGKDIVKRGSRAIRLMISIEPGEFGKLIDDIYSFKE
jgi:hypothetical protein